MRFINLLFFMLFLCTSYPTCAELADTIEKIKPSVVGIGIYNPTSRPQNQLRGSGFVIADGLHIATNNHVLPKGLNSDLLEEVVVFVGKGKSAKRRKATIIARDEYHDLAILKISGAKLTPFELAADEYKREGSYIAFTGFPIGAILGLYPVTHRGIIASITPVVIPAKTAGQISPKMLKKMRNPYKVYQLDATAYPGNSGSAMYDIQSGKVIGIINKVFVQETKETVLSKPSGITYAIPVTFLKALMKQHQLE